MINGRTEQFTALLQNPLLEANATHWLKNKYIRRTEPRIKNSLLELDYEVRVALMLHAKKIKQIPPYLLLNRDAQHAVNSEISKAILQTFPTKIRYSPEIFTVMVGTFNKIYFLTRGKNRG